MDISYSFDGTVFAQPAKPRPSRPSTTMYRYLTEAQQRQLVGTLKALSSLQARRDLAWITLLRDTGMRIGEFSRMDVGDARLALQSGWLFIPREHRKGKRSDHSVPVTRTVREALAALLGFQREMGGSGADDEPLVLSRKHQRMSVRAYQERVAHWCRAAGFEASPHWLRHTRAMNIMRKTTSRDPRGIVQAALGHASISSTGIYTRVTKEQLRAALDEVDGTRAMARGGLRKAWEERRVSA